MGSPEILEPRIISKGSATIRIPLPGQGHLVAVTARAEDLSVQGSVRPGRIILAGDKGGLL